MKNEIVRKRNQYARRGQVVTLTIVRRTGDEVTARFDADLLAVVKRFVWRVQTGGRGTMSVVTGSADKRTYQFLSHLVVGGVPAKGLEVFALDNDLLNCRRSNLRIGTRSQVMQNTSRAKQSTTMVYQRKDRPGWWARLYIGRSKYRAIGPFGTQIEAEQERVKANAAFYAAQSAS